MAVSKNHKSKIKNLYVSISIVRLKDLELQDRSSIVMRIVGVEYRVSKTVKVEKAKQEDLIVLTRRGLDGNKDTGISVI